MLKLLELSKDIKSLTLEELQQRVVQLENQLQQHEFLVDITNLLLKGKSMGETLNAILQLAIDITKSEAGLLLLNNEGSGQCIVSQIIGLVPELLVKELLSLSAKLFPSYDSDVLEVNSSNQLFRKLTFLDHKLESLIVIPLAVEKKINGYAIVMHRHEGMQLHSSHYTLHQVHNLKVFASQAALLLENTKLKIQEGRQELYYQTLSSLITAIDAKDIYTQNHSVRVANMVVQFSEYLGLDKDSIDDYHYGALLHDIGKIGVTDNILNKPGRLDQQEFEIIRQHPILGAKILEPMKPNKDVLLIVRHHHERYDGKGYPAGIKGQEISLGARIVNIVDAWDAMTSNRAYRAMLSREIVLNELIKGGGGQFDPELVKEFIELLANDYEQVI